jgi:hypothetical protein
MSTDAVTQQPQKQLFLMRLLRMMVVQALTDVHTPQI